MKSILIIFLGNILHDSRTFKMKTFFTEIGFEVKIICAHLPKERLSSERDVFFVKLKNFKRAIFKIAQFYAKALTLSIKLKSDIVISSDLYCLPLAFLNSKIHGSFFIYDSREFYSSLASLSGRNLSQKLLDKFEKFFARSSNLILTVNDEIKKLLNEKFPQKKILTIRNLPSVSIFKEKNKIYEVSRYLSEGENPAGYLLYIGNFHPGRGFDIYFNLIRKMDNLKLILIGKGELEDELKRKVKDMGIEDKVIFLPAYSPNEILKFPEGKKFIGLSLIEPTSISYYLSLPNKIFEYTQLRIPFVASDFPEIKKIVEKYKIGLTANPSDVEDIMRKVETLLRDDSLYSDFQNNCLQALSELSFEEEMKRLLEFIR